MANYRKCRHAPRWWRLCDGYSCNWKGGKCPGRYKYRDLRNRKERYEPEREVDDGHFKFS